MRSPWSAVPFVLLALLALSIGPARAAVDCGCGDTGDYVSPFEPAGLTANESGSSPHGKYLLTAVDNTGSIQITIDEVSPARQVLSMAIPPGSAWGFSPDDDRFTYHFLVGSIETARLFNLASASPATSIWEGSSNPVASETVFSPHGVYLLYVAIDVGQQTDLTLVDARTGTFRYHDSPIASTAAGDSADVYALQGWGFGPDSTDRSFVYASSFGAQWVDFKLVNLSSQAVVHDETILAIASFWQFSPCGDVLAIVNQDTPRQETTVLRRTSDGQMLAQRSDTFLSTIDTNPDISFSSTPGEHVATVGATPHDMTPNVAALACPASPTLLSLRLVPDSVSAGKSSTGVLTLTAPAEAGGATVAVSYLSAEASGPASVAIAAGHSGASFPITTSAVQAPTQVTIRGTLAAHNEDAVLTIVPLPPELSAFTLSANTVLGGTPVDAYVSLTDGAPLAGATVLLTSSNPAAATIDSSVVMTQGQGGATAHVTTSWVEAPDSTILTASYRSRIRTQKLVVRPVSLRQVRESAHCLVGGDSLYAEVGLDGPAGPAGALVALSCDRAAVTLPASVLIPSGASFATFGVATSPVAAQVVARLTASLRGLTVVDSFTLFDRMDVVVRDLGTLEGFFDDGAFQPGYYGHASEGRGLNNSGQVFGRSDAPESGNGAPFRWSAGSMADLGFLTINDAAANAYGINDAGVVVGESEQVGCIFASGTVTDIPLVDGTAYAINSAGHVAGGPGASHAAWLYDGSATDLGLLPGTLSSVATALNDSDVVVGTAQDSLYNQHAFRWTAAGGMVALPVPPGTTSCYPLGINRTGSIVGYCVIGFGTHAIAWQDTTITRIEAPGTRFLGVNNTGLTLGTVQNKPTVWNGSTAYTIQDALQGACDLQLLQVTAINDLGQMSGTALVGSSTDDISHAVLITSKSTSPWMQGLTAVEASGEVVTSEPTRITLRWATREIVLARTRVERRQGDGGWEDAGEPRAGGSSQLTFVDEGLLPGLEYSYRLAVQEGGSTRYVGLVGARTSNRLALAINGFRPNPARAGDVVVYFSLPAAGDVRIEMFDVHGRRSASRDASGLAAGTHQMLLARTNALSPGIYFVRLTHAGNRRIARLAIAP